MNKSFDVAISDLKFFFYCHMMRNKVLNYHYTNLTISFLIVTFDIQCQIDKT